MAYIVGVEKGEGQGQNPYPQFPGLSCSPSECGSEGVGVWPQHYRPADSKEGRIVSAPGESGSLPIAVVLTPPKSLVAAIETRFQPPDHSAVAPAAIVNQIAAWPICKPGSLHQLHPSTMVVVA